MSEPAAPGQSTLRFAVFEFDPSAGELRKKGRKLRIEGQPLQVLQILLERAGQVVTREELRQRLWPGDTFVDFEQGVNSAVRRLRQALDDSAQTPRFIETLPRRGYRFIFPLATEAASSSSQPPPRPRGLTGRRALYAAACFAGILAGLAIMRPWEPFRNSDARRPSIRLAVLPFENVAAGDGQGYLLDEIHAELIDRLNEISAFAVTARESAILSRERSRSPADIGRMLSVDAVLFGEAHRTRQGWRLTIHLASVHEGDGLWSESFDQEDRNLSLIPSYLARLIAAHFNVALTARENARLAQAKPVDPSLLRAYANGRHHLEKWTPDGVEKAIRCFREATDIDATYAPAWAALGEAYLSTEFARPEGEVTLSDEDRRRRAEAALLQAIDLDPTLREPHQSMGRLKLQAWDWSGAAREFHLAQEADPGHPGFAVYLLATGSFAEAVEAQRREAAMNPLGYASQLTLGWTAFMAGQFDVAIPALKATIDLEPAFPNAHRELAWACAGKGMYEEALQACERARELMQRQRSKGEVSGGCEWVYALAGRRAEALDMARAIELEPGGGGHKFTRLAHVHDALGDRERALAYLRQAYDLRAAALPREWSIPMLSAGIKADRRFQEIIRGTGIPWARFPTARTVGILARPDDGSPR